MDEQIKGRIESIVYHNNENDYTVLEISDDKENLITAVGNIAMPGEGEEVTLVGYYTYHKEFGKQFAFTSYEKSLPREIEGIIQYLSSGMIKGVGPVTALKIVNRFGLDTFDIIEQHPDWLADIPGITRKKAAAIAESFMAQQELYGVMMFFKDYLDVCKYLGCNVVGSETGSYNGDPWIYHPENHSDAALERVVSVFSNLADYALSREEYIGMEGAFGHVCHTPERLFEAIQRINRDNIRVIFDLYNYLDISNFESAYEILDRGLDLFGEKILLFHIKDFVVDGDKLRQCGVGRGILDYDKIITKIYQHNPDAILVLEGTTGEDIDYALSFLREKINKVTYYSKES